MTLLLLVVVPADVFNVSDYYRIKQMVCNMICCLKHMLHSSFVFTSTCANVCSLVCVVFVVFCMAVFRLCFWMFSDGPFKG